MFRVLLLPKSVLPNYPSESTSELQAVVVSLFILVLKVRATLVLMQGTGANLQKTRTPTKR